MDLLIESIEGGTYLASIRDGERNYYVYDEDNRPKAFHCINEIKTFLANDSFEKVWLKETAPYDEMCGMDAYKPPVPMEIDWH